MPRPRGKSFTPDQNARIRAAARELLKEHEDNRTKLAAVLGVSQPAFSNFLNGVTGAGPQLASAVAELKRVTMSALIGDEPRIDPSESQVRPMRDATALGNHRDWPAAREKLLRRHDEETVEGVASVSLGSGLPEFLDEYLLMNLAEGIAGYERERKRRASEGK